MTGRAARGPADDWRIDVGADTVTAVYDTPPGAAPDTLFVCAHGAGGHLGDLAMSGALHAMLAAGLGVLRFNFVYREKGSKRPDPMPQLQACFERVVHAARERLAPRTLILGGRSMGGRAASMLAAGGFACEGLLLLAYPLHPAGEPAKLRTAHLPRLGVPVLCFNGTRDALCEKPLMDRTLADLPAPVRARWTMHWLAGADHSFHVLKSSGRTDAQVLDEIAAATRAWRVSALGAAH